MTLFMFDPESLSAVEKLHARMSMTPATPREVLGSKSTLTVLTPDNTKITLAIECENTPIKTNAGSSVLPIHVRFGDIRCLANIKLPPRYGVVTPDNANMQIRSEWGNKIIAAATKASVAKTAQLAVAVT